MQSRRTNFHVRFLLSAVILGIISITSCNQEDYTPKPRGYFRISLPEKQYRTLDSIYPYTFEYPRYVNILPDAQSPEEKYWINLDFNSLRGTMHLSYKPVKNKETLNTYIEDSRALAMKHIPKASSIEQITIAYPEHHVYGLIYDIKGLGAASPYQFYVTDGQHHFLRGALYFNAVPNSDSLMPVINFVKKDILHLIETLRWNQEDYTPKPKGHFRISLHEKQYQTLDSIYPYTFEYPRYVNILPDAQPPEEKYWINLDFNSLQGTMHLSYKPMNNRDTLNTYIEDSRALAMKHIPKASSIEQITIAYPEHQVYGLVYDIKGLGAASPYQFYATDSLHHFLYGALYCNAVPNSDSLMPVINFAKKDIHHLIETLRWE